MSSSKDESLAFSIPIGQIDSASQDAVSKGKKLNNFYVHSGDFESWTIVLHK